MRRRAARVLVIGGGLGVLLFGALAVVSASLPGSFLLAAIASLVGGFALQAGGADADADGASGSDPSDSSDGASDSGGG